MRLIYDSRSKAFVAESSYEERELPKAAGFTWSRIVRGRWATTDLNKAKALAQYADAACRSALAEALNGQAETLKLSSATSANVAVPVPDGLEYYGFQKAGIAFALRTRRALIADEMGLGKTIQAIGVVNAVPEIKRVLVITKASLRINWRNELTRWLVRKLSVGLATGQTWPDTDVVVINYDILRNHKAVIDSIGWDLLVMDEAHLIKNPKAIRTQMVFGCVPKKPGQAPIPEIRAKYAIATTGSPLENRPLELWSLLHYLDPRVWSSFWQYAQRFCGAVHNGFGWDFSGSSNKEELQRKLRQTVMVRRLKRDVLHDLPEKQYQVIEIPVEDENLRMTLADEFEEFKRRARELRNLAAAVRDARRAGDEAEYRRLVGELKAGLKARFEEFSERRHETGLRKLPYVTQYLKDMLEDEPHKALVFGHHRDILEKLTREFKGSALIHGGVQPDKRQAIVDAYQANPNMYLFFGSIGAAGAGLNITSASHVIFIEEDVVPERMRQAEDRAHRIGQKNSVLVTHLVLEGSLDAHLAQIAAGKAGVIEVILGTGNSQSEPVKTDGWGSLCPNKKSPSLGQQEPNVCPF